MKQYYTQLYLTNSDSSAAERATSLRELCKINRDAITNALDRPPVKDESDGWIVKKGGHAFVQDSDEEKTSSPSVSPDETSYGSLAEGITACVGPFSTFAYDDFLEFEYPKKQQIKRLSSERGYVDSKPPRSHEEEGNFQPKKMRLHTKSPGPNVDMISVDSSVRIGDFLPSSETSGKALSNSIYQTEWSSQKASQPPASNAPMHSHLRCVDPNKTWNMITRTTGPTTPLHPPSQHTVTPAPPRVVQSRPNLPSAPHVDTWPDELRRQPSLPSSCPHPSNRKVEANKQRALARLQENR